jgi:hypothetical protein
MRQLLLALGSGLTLALGLVVAPAGAFVTTVKSTKVGLQSREAEFVFEGTPFVESFDNPEGNPVLHKNETYAIYWDPTDHYHGDWQHLIDNFLQGLGAESHATNTVFAVDSQYTDRSNAPASYLSTFRGAYTDTDPYPTPGKCTDPHPLAVPDLIGPVVAKKHTEVCLTDAQLRTELKAFIAAHSLQKGVSSIFYLLTPPGVTVCLDGGEATGHCSDHTGSLEETGTESYKNSFCSYHSDFSNITLENTTTANADTVLYGVIPWTAGGLGDYHLVGADRTPAYDCQDGGFYFNPLTSRHEKEKAKEPKIESKKEKEEHPKNEEEEQKQKEAQEKAVILEGPHQEEPRQNGVGPDGSPDTGLADLIVSQIGVQQQNIVTNPLLNAWKDEAGNEVTDECRNAFQPYLGGSVTANELTFAGTLYNQSLAGANAYINDAFNMAAGRLPYPGAPCLTGISLVPQFTSPNTVHTSELVGFDGMESNITLNDNINYSKTNGAEQAKYATYTWDFGDETPKVTGVAPGAPTLNSPETSPCAAPWEAPCAASTYHSYQYGGTYSVTLTVTDTGGDTAEVTNPITVLGPLRPSPPAGGPGKEAPSTSPATPGAGSGSQAASSTHGGAPVSIVPDPVASAAVASKSLRTVLRNGLVIHYSVNEQVAGRFEVMLNASIARRLGIHGPRANGLPAGSAPSIVVAKAILVTTKGGRNTVKILFAKQTAARLHKLRQVSLTLRMIVRNASSQNPKSTTVLSTVTLHR